MGETALTAAEQNYYFALSEYLDWGEYGCVSAIFWEWYSEHQ